VRLKELSPQTGPRQTSAQPRIVERVFLHYNDGADAGLVEKLQMALASDLGKGRVMAPQLVSAPSNGDVRYFFREDEKLARRVKDSVEEALAGLGYKIGLSILFRDSRDYTDAKPGTVEVWLPPLSRPLPTSQ
jgi:hypothetical protein